METKGSSPRSQQPAIYPSPKPDESRPRPRLSFLNIHFNIILP